jgi:hypothetical protein
MIAVIKPSRILDRFGRVACRCPCHSRAPVRSRHPRLPMSWGLRSLIDRVRPETLNGTGLMIRPNGDPSGTSGLLISPARGLTVTSTGTCTNCGCGSSPPCSSCTAISSSISASFSSATINGVSFSGTYSLSYFTTSGGCCGWGVGFPISSGIEGGGGECGGSPGTTCVLSIVFTTGGSSCSCPASQFGGCDLGINRDLVSNVSVWWNCSCLSGEICDVSPTIAWTAEFSSLSSWCTSGGSITSSSSSNGSVTITS